MENILISPSRIEAAKRFLKRKKYVEISKKLMTTWKDHGIGEYVQRPSPYFAPFLAALKESFGSFKGKRVLQVGALPNPLSLALEDLGAVSHTLDLNQLTSCKSKKILRENTVNSSAVTAKAEKMPLQSGKYDAVVSDCFLKAGYLSEELEEAIGREVDRVLKPGGTIVLLGDKEGHPFGKGVRVKIKQQIRHMFPNLLILEKNKQ